MGNQSSKSKQVTDILNKTATEIMVRQTTNASGTLTADQTVNISGNTGNVNGVRIEQVGSIDLSVAQRADVNADLQEKLVTGLTSTITQSRSDFPQLNSANTESDIQNIVRNEVSAKFSVESLAALQMDIKQKQAVAITENGGNVTDVAITQTAKGVGALVNTLSSDIVKKLSTETTVTATSEQKTTFFGADLLNAVGGMFTGIFGAMGPLLIVAICAGGLLLFYYMYSGMMGGSVPLMTVDPIKSYQPAPPLQL